MFSDGCEEDKANKFCKASISSSSSSSFTKVPEVPSKGCFCLLEEGISPTKFSEFGTLRKYNFKK